MVWESETIIECMKDAYKRGWITSKDGNISVVCNNTFFITATGVDKQRLKINDVLQFKIDRNGELVGDKTRASIETRMHYLIHKQNNFKDGVVMHFHPTHTVACMLAGIKLSQIHKYFPELNRYTKVGKCVDYIFPGEHELADQVANNILNNDIVGLKGHGTTSYGEDFEEAFQHTERLEHCCQMALLAGAFTGITND